MQNPAAAREFADHMALVRRLRVAAGGGGAAGDDDSNASDADAEEIAGAMPHSNAFGAIDGGEEA
eukprot:10979194-Alexandrium_andersonii.AAC.1